MAVITTALDSNIVASYQIGVAANGSPVTRQKTFSGVKSAAASQDIYDVTETFFDMLSYPLIKIRRDDRSELTSED